MIKSIHLKNIQSHKDTKLEFSKGVTAIVGTSDSGKTSVVRALQWIRKNRPSGLGIIRKGEAEAFVDILMVDGNHITKTKGKNKNEYTFNDFNFASVGKDVPQEVIDGLGLQDINLQQQLDDLFLIFQSPGKLAAIFNKYTKLDDGEALRNAIQSDVRKLKQDHAKLTNELEAIDIEIQGYNWLSDYKTKLDEYETITKKQIEISDNIENITNLSKNIDAEQILQDDLLKTLQGKEKRIQTFQNWLDKAEKVISELFELTNLSEKLNILIGTITKETTTGKNLSNNLLILKAKLEIYNEICQIILETNSLSCDRDNINQILTKYTLEVSKKEDDLAQLENLKVSLSEKKQTLSQIGICPFCESVLTPKNKEILLRNIR